MDYAKLARWFTEQASKIPYGEITLKIIRHDGQDRLIEKNILIKEKPEAPHV